MADRTVRVTLTASVQGYVDGMRQMREAGKSVTEIAEFMRCDRSSVRYGFRRMGIHFEPTKPPTEDQIAEMREMKQIGLRTVRIAERTGWSEPTVRKYLR